MLMCEIHFLDRPAETVYIGIPRGVYLLPHRQLADARFGPVWCRDCRSFNEGERLESVEDVVARREAIGSGTFSVADRFLFARDEESFRQSSKSWRSSLALRRWRKSPAHCGRCFGTSLDSLDGRDVAHPATGERLRAEYVFASTSGDFRVTIMTCEGMVLGEIYGYDSAGRQINSSYPYDELSLLLTDAGIDPDA